MLTILTHVRTEWFFYFTGDPTHLQQSEFTSRKTPSYTSVYVLNCFFRSITSTSDGGALSCTSVTYLIIESTTFFSINTSSQNGGAIYFYNNGGQCALHKVCGNDCITSYSSGNSFGQFAFISVNNGISSKNYVYYTSITRCVNEYTNSFRTLHNEYGKIYLPSVNISMNQIGYTTGINSNPYADSNSVTFSLLYSTFRDNNASVRACIFVWRTNANFEIKSCNFLGNKQGNLNLNGIICANGNMKIMDSCILNNVATNVFYQETSSYTITLSNCTVDSTTCNQNLKIQNTVTKSFIQALNHISTRYCHFEYDSVGTLTPIIQPSKKQINCYTCDRFFDQSMPQMLLFFVLSYFS
jgi:predicted outer membrane repeat protein